MSQWVPNRVAVVVWGHIGESTIGRMHAGEVQVTRVVFLGRYSETIVYSRIVYDTWKRTSACSLVTGNQVVDPLWRRVLHQMVTVESKYWLLVRERCVLEYSNRAPQQLLFLIYEYFEYRVPDTRPCRHSTSTYLPPMVPWMDHKFSTFTTFVPWKRRQNGLGLPAANSTNAKSLYSALFITSLACTVRTTYNSANETNHVTSLRFLLCAAIGISTSSSNFRTYTGSRHYPTRIADRAWKVRINTNGNNISHSDSLGRKTTLRTRDLVATTLCRWCSVAGWLCRNKSALRILRFRAHHFIGELAYFGGLSSCQSDIQRELVAKQFIPKHSYIHEGRSQWFIHSCLR